VEKRRTGNEEKCEKERGENMSFKKDKNRQEMRRNIPQERRRNIQEKTKN
jgi:hypothetical protein